MAKIKRGIIVRESEGNEGQGGVREKDVKECLKKGGR